MTEGRDLAFPESAWVETLVARSLAEDIGGGDVSTSLAVAPGRAGAGRIVSRGAGVIAGLPLVRMVYTLLSPTVTLGVKAPDGAAVTAGQTVAHLRGPAAALLAGERTALNYLQHLSGIASLTARYVAAVAGTGCRVLDTRKTLPGYRALAKYAVRAGGGENHRFGLYDRVMIKDNHWAAAGAPIGELVARARGEHPELAVEIEVDDLAQLGVVLPLGVEWILLDNFTAAAVVAAVRMRDDSPGGARTRLEASGNLSLENVRAYAEAGVDAVSIGRLTHSAPALDLALEFSAGPSPRESVPGAVSP